MSDPSRDDIPAGLTSGRLEGVSLPDLVWTLCRRRKTGVLAVSRGAVTKTVYFEDGRIVFAASSDPEDRLGETFLRDGTISLDQLDEALGQLHTGKRIGTLLVEAGNLSAPQLVRGVLSQVQAIVLDMFGWEEGEYRFTDGALPTEEVIKLGIKTSELVLDGIRRIRSFGRIRRSVGAARTTYGLAEGWREALEGIDLSDGEELLLARLEQSDESVEWLCREVFLSNFEIYQTLWGFRVLGVVQERDSRIERPGEAAYEGSLTRQGFADILVRLCRAGETGVLYVTRGSRERTFHIDGERCLFATSNDTDDGLVSYLLQRGVISLRDREETAKRLLSNKRVGTILRELGVIDDRDLQDMVREQLAQIVHDTFRWTEGEYAFVPGALPSIESITLDQTIESLVSEGMRRVEAWQRVREGCGDLDAPLALTPAYEGLLDAMAAGPEEWQVVTALSSPRSPRQVCRVSEMSDFRVCQIIWTLRVLGAVRAAPAESVGRTPARGAIVAQPRRIEVEELDAASATAPPAEPVREVADVGEPPLPEPAAARSAGARFERATDSPGDGPSPPRAANVDSPDDPSTDSGNGVTESAEGPEGPSPVREELASTVEAGAAERRFVDPISAVDSGKLGAGEELDQPAVDEEPIADPEPAGFEPCDAAQEGALEDEPIVDAGPGEVEPRDAAQEVALEDEPIVDAEPGEVEPRPGAVDGMYEQKSVVDAGRGEVETRDVADAPPVEHVISAPVESDRTDGADEIEVEPMPPVAEDETETRTREAAGEPGAEERPFADADAAEPVEVETRLADDENPDERSAEATLAITPEERDAALASPPDADDPAARTQKLDREQVEAALAAGAVPVEPAWDPPDGLDVAIARFNAAQRIVFRAVRTEVGAGASNFIRAACGRDSGQSCDPVAEVELLADGSWDADGLRRTVVEHRIERPWEEYERLIEREIELLRGHVSEAKVVELERQIERIDLEGTTR